MEFKDEAEIVPHKLLIYLYTYLSNHNMMHRFFPYVHGEAKEKLVREMKGVRKIGCPRFWAVVGALLLLVTLLLCCFQKNTIFYLYIYEEGPVKQSMSFE